MDENRGVSKTVSKVAMTFDLTDIIALVTLIQLIFLTVVILNYRKGRLLSNRLLAGFMASNALLIAHWLFSHLGWISLASLTIVRSVGGSSYFLMMPFLYLYLRSLCYKDFQLRVAHLLHLAPFVIFVIFSYAAYSFNSASPRLASSFFLNQNITRVESLTHEIVLHLQIFSYLIASSAVLIGYRRKLREIFSSLDRIDLQWCNILLAGFTLMWLLDLLNWGFGMFHLIHPSVSYRMFVGSLLVNLSLTLIVTYKGLAQSASFSGIQGLSKYSSSRLKISDCDQIAGELIAMMEKEKTYLSPSLSIDDLSQKLNVPSRNLSQIIHTHFNKNFYDFINSYRIEEVKKRIHDERYRHFTLVAIAFDSGFNSKSVFNAAFKKHASMTPREFKLLHSS